MLNKPLSESESESSAAKVFLTAMEMKNSAD